jgi:hypothetical protein
VSYYKKNSDGCRIALQEPVASPSASCTQGRPSCTRRSLPRVQHSEKSLRLILSRGRRLPRVPKIMHSGKASPSVVSALGEDLTPSADDRCRFLFLFSFPSVFLPRVQHSGRFLSFFKKTSSLSAASQTLGEEICFFKPSSPSATAQTLGEEICFF